MTLISRNPFAREEMHRELIPIEDRPTCSFCSQIAKFRYFIEPDSVTYRRNDISGQFCSIGCMRSYHDC